MEQQTTRKNRQPTLKEAVETFDAWYAKEPLLDPATGHRVSVHVLRNWLLRHPDAVRALLGENGTR